MYLRINKELGLSISDNIIKTLASGVATNLAAYAAGILALNAVFSLVPGIGTVGAAGIAGAVSYALCIVSGVIYLKILTKIFLSGKSAHDLTAEELKEIAKKTIQETDVKGMMCIGQQFFGHRFAF